MLMLHGIYGAGRNWASVARRFVRDRPDWGVILVDLRMHGASQGFSPPHTVQACADDVVDLVAHLGMRPEAILGHSFGGKVALLYAREAVPSVVWVIDSTPAAREPDGSAWAMLGVLRRHPGPFADRDSAIRGMESEGFALPVAQWMSTNLEPTGGGELSWRLDVDVMEALMISFFETDAWDVVEAPPVGTEIHMVRALESSVLDPAACARIRRAGEASGRVFLHEVAGGHWLNADNPDALHELLVETMV